MNIINVAPFDELVTLINSLSDEKSKRILLSKAADVYGNGGKAHIVDLTGITYPTLIAGRADSENDEVISSNRIRREGAGRKPTTETYPDITEAIEKIIDGNIYMAIPPRNCIGLHQPPASVKSVISPKRSIP